MLFRSGEFVAIRGEVLAKSLSKTRSGKKIFSLVVDDGSGRIPCVWFNQAYLDNVFEQGDEAVFIGKVQRYRTLQMSNPEFEKVKEDGGGLNQVGRIIPLYPLTEGLNQKTLRTIIDRTLDEFLPVIPELLPPDLLERWKVIPLRAAIREIHYPTGSDGLLSARKRLILDEFFILQLALGIKRNQRISQSFSLPHNQDTPLRDRYIKELPFRLTGAQRRVINEIKRDMTGSRVMNRLLQGDVGSGKTVVAVTALLTTVDNGYQGAIMAPTEILANQHYENISRELKPLGIEVVLLTGGVKGAGRKRILEGIEDGTIPIVVGTQALIQKKVSFKKLGMIVIDEQHKFGVRQRSDLRGKGPEPHVLVMTATPIPRTLTMTVYGDLDLSTLDEMPPGRKPVKTIHRYDSSRLRVFGFMKEQIAKGGQVYVVYPLIQESEKMDYKDLEDGFESITRAFPLPEYKVSVLHGKMKTADKDFGMQRFVKGQTNILVSTTVLEVGVDVPNASVMVIESAERFGLSQLHQLRGRVGRGADQSYCILMTDVKLTSEGKLRMETMTRTSDGFEVAEVDLKLRGPGDLTGTQQSGILALKIADLARDGQILQHARDTALKLLNDDPALEKPANQKIANQYRALQKDRQEWGRIS